jgi:hypothetical protein
VSRTVGRWSFPAVPDEGWSPATRARWDTARQVADAMTGAGGAVDRFGWQVESAGRIPGMGRCLALWALSPVAGVGVVHLLTPTVGLVGACYTAVGVGAAGVLTGAVITLRADTAHRPPETCPAPGGRDDADDPEDIDDGEGSGDAGETARPPAPVPVSGPAPVVVAVEAAVSGPRRAGGAW